MSQEKRSVNSVKVPTQWWEICPQCGHEVSGEREICPRCFTSLKRRHRYRLLLIALVIVGVGGVVFLMLPSATSHQPRWRSLWPNASPDPATLQLMENGKEAAESLIKLVLVRERGFAPENVTFAEADVTDVVTKVRGAYPRRFQYKNSMRYKDASETAREVTVIAILDAIGTKNWGIQSLELHGLEFHDKIY